MRTSYTLRGTIRHPAMGAWLVKMAGRRNPTLPPNIRIGGDSQHPGAGFLEAAYAPLPIGDPSAGLQNSLLPASVSEALFHKRIALANRLDQSFQEKYDQVSTRAYADAYREALRLMRSQDLAAFDLDQESAVTREAYGQEPFGQGCLLARRLIEKEVRFVEVSFGGWDTHQNNFDRVPELAQVLDQALSALLEDLAQRGLLKDTLVVLATEFGRTPEINANNGRDHYPKAFSCMLAGAGIRGGTVYGRTSSDGSEVEESGVGIPDFNATIAHAAGVMPDASVVSASGRPFKVASKGKPVLELFG